MSRQFTFFLVIVFILTLFAVSSAGYFAQTSYRAYMENGYYTGSLDDETGNPLSFVGSITSVLLLPVALMALTRRISPFILAFLVFSAWVGVSAAWSDVIGPSIVLVVKTIVYALGIGVAVKRLSYRQILVCIAIVAFGVCGASFYLCFSNPIFRISIGADGWRGLFEQKNRFAMFALFSMLLVFPAAFRRDTRVIAIFVMPILLASLIVSQSKTSLTIALAYIAVTSVFTMLSRRRGASKRGLIGLSLTLVALLVTAAVVIGVLISLGGVTFTGRVNLWRWFLDDLGGRLLIGTGGITAPGDPSFVARAQSARMPPTSDNSYIMVLYNQGVVGILLYIGIITAMWARCLKIGGNNAVFAIMTLVSYMIFAFSESDARFFIGFPSVALLVQLLTLEKLMPSGYGVTAASMSRPVNRHRPIAVN